jgi:uncharacterized repeat protein (TIGR03803 family)
MKSAESRGLFFKVSLQVASTLLALGIVLVVSQIAAALASAQTFAVMYNFAGSSDGELPYAGLVRDSARNLYGTTIQGGDPTCTLPAGCGVVFKVDPSGTETVLYKFTGGADGGHPQAALIRDTAGNLYGTTLYGGDLNCEAPYGCGTVFKLSKDGKETVQHRFTGTPDGAYPLGGVIQDSNGNLYGTTSVGGSSNVGTVFKLSQSGKETALHSFEGGPSDGAIPVFTGLIMDDKGNFYGVTEEGGASSAGVVYKLSKRGRLTVLHSFTFGTADGSYPWGTPAMDKAGNLYGTTTSGGSAQDGVVWKVSNTGKETVLHNFLSYPSDGAQPEAGVIMDVKGNLYGTTVFGGSSGDGSVYKLNSKRVLTLLHSFSYSTDGGNPVGGLIRDANGKLYSTAYQGGESGYGTVWKLTP